MFWISHTLIWHPFREALISGDVCRKADMNANLKTTSDSCFVCLRYV